MRYLNFRLLTLLAAGLSFVAVPALVAQDPAQSAAAAPIRGDVDGDGRVTSRDAQAVRAYLVRGTVPAGGAILPAGDANGDGRITSADAVLISRFAAGVDVSRFGVGRPVGGGGAQEPVAGGRVLGLYECTADVAAGRMSCAPAAPDAGGARLDVIVGSPNVTIASTGNVLSRDGVGEDTTTSSVTVKNNIGQPLGTTDGTNAASTGTRLFFSYGPVVSSVNSGTVAGSSVRIDNQDGIATFVEGSTTHADKKYFQYDGVLATGATSAAEPIRFVYSSNVKTFKFSVLVSAPVQYEQGWITVTPATAAIAPGGTVALSTASFTFTGAAIASDPVTWSSSDPAVATVNASGVVTAVADGSATITATSSSTPQRTGRAVVTVDAAPTVASTTPANGASSVSPGANIQIAFSEAVTVAESSFQLECPAGSALGFSVGGSGTSTITLDPTADLPSGITCQVTVVAAQVSDADTNDGLDKLAADYVFSFDVSIEAVADAFGTTTTGNVRINSESTSPVFSVTANDKIPAAATISFAGWNGTSGKTQNGGDVSMTTSGEGRGRFSYNPPAGFEGTDSLEYTVQVGSMTSSAKVALPVSGMIWFVNNAAAPCTSRANGCGRLTSPYSSLAAFQAENNGTGNNPAAGDAVFLYESASTYTGPVTLLAQQKLIGQDAGASLSTITGITPATGSDALPAMNTGGSTVTIAGAAGGVVLGADNLLRGFGITTTGGTALAGTGFGTPNIAEVPISATGGAALSLTNGTLNSTFPSVSSTNSTGRGISLTDVNGSPTFTAGSISGAAQAAFLVSGGNVGFTWPGSIGQANNAPLVDVQGSHTGTLTFSGALTATNGAGLQFNAAQGAYTFSGTTTLGGTDAGIDITNGSGGTFTFGTGAAITNSAGTGVNVYGSAPTVTYSGSITKSGTSTGRLVEVGEQTGGTVTFNTGTLLANSTNNLSTGISLSNADGTVNFNGTTTLNGGDAGVDIVSGSAGTITFGAGASVTNASGELIRIANGSSPLAFTYSGSFQRSSGTGAGIAVESTTGATITFDGNPATETKSLVLAAGSTAAGVNLTGTNTGSTFNFTNGGLVVSTDDGAAFTATGGGTANVTGSNNTLSATGGTALNVQNTAIGSSRLTFQSIAANGGANGIVLNNTGSVGGLTVTGTGVALSGGTLQNHTQVGIVLTTTFDPKFNNVRVLNTTHSGVHGKGVTNFEFTNGTIDQSGDGPSPGASVNESNLLFYDFANTSSSTNVSGAVTITGNALSNALYHGIYIYNRGGTISNLNVSNNVITTPTSSTNSVGSGIVVDLQGGGASITKGNIDNNNIHNVPTGVGINLVCGGVSAFGTCGTPGSATNVISISKDTIWGVSAAAPIGSEGIVANMNGQGQGNFVLDQNNIRHTKGRAMGVSAFGQVRMQSAVTNNVIVSTPLFDATNMEIGADSTSGIASFASYTATVTSNNVSGHTGVGIYAIARASSDTLKVKLIGNTVAAPNTTSSARAGIRVDAGSSAGAPVVCARVESNVTGGSTNTATATTSPGINIRRQNAGATTAGAVFGIHGLTPNPATGAQAVSYMAPLNPASTSGAGFTTMSGGVASLSGTTYNACTLN